jgi:hypothetical protein
MRTAATWTLLVALAVPPAAHAQNKPAPQQASQSPSPPKIAPPEEGVIPPPGEPPPPPSPTQPPPEPPPRPQPVHKKHAWIQPTVIALEAGAVAFAIASITVLSVGGRDDTWRYPAAGGLGGGVIVCAGAGIIIELVAR